MTKKKKIVLIVVAIVILIAVVVAVIIAVNINRSKDRISGKEEESIETAMADKEEGSTDSTFGDETPDIKPEGNTQSGTQSATGKPDGDNQAGIQSATEESEGGSQTGTQNTTEKPGGNNQSGSQNTEKPTTEAPTTESSGSGNGGGSGHQHTWEAQYKTVHHDEEGHYEKVCVQEAYDEPIYEGCYICNYCGKNLGKDQLSHCLTCGPPMSPDDPFYTPGATEGSSYRTERVQVDIQHHDAVYEQKWVVDQKAYDEEVLTGYKCTTCGATKK